MALIFYHSLLHFAGINILTLRSIYYTAQFPYQSLFVLQINHSRNSQPQYKKKMTINLELILIALLHHTNECNKTSDKFYYKLSENLHATKFVVICRCTWSDQTGILFAICVPSNIQINIKKLSNLLSLSRSDRHPMQLPKITIHRKWNISVGPNEYEIYLFTAPVTSSAGRWY